ncbi:O-antigen ligase family protein [Oceanobacillus halotolerans]|uniref:O-antigen ligase family protein n=1 Tax=Oceanobacillus halotolerans TaxID=2663380 RepID=UPI0013DCD658|nr:O-antigen ligase family protein [Oceanobacillus halotolerans]
MKGFIFFFLAIIFLLSPYEKGLYFDEDFYGIQVILCSLFMMLMIILMVKKEIASLKPIWFMAIIPFCYAITLFIAENPLGAWQLLLRWTSYIAFFFMLYWVVREDSKIQRLLPGVFQLTGVWMAIHMMLNHFNGLDFHDAIINERFAGVFQYPNTFGMMMSVFYLFSLIMLLRRDESMKHYIFYSIPLVLFMVSFIESYSRGMYVVFPIAWLIGLCFLKPSLQVKYLLYTGISVVFALISSAALQAGIAAVVLLIGLSSVMVAIILILEKKLYTRKRANFPDLIDKKQLYRFLAPVAILLLSVLLISDLSYKGLVYQQLPDTIQERVSSISSSSTARERLLFAEDALNMSQDSPIIGFGGQAWGSMYKQYQQLPYQSNKIHNAYLEFMIDIGWVGLIIVLTVFSFLFYRIYQNYRQATEKTSYIAVIVAIVTIFIHSFIDFNLAYGTVWFVVFWLCTMGLMKKPVKQKQQKQEKASYYEQFGMYAFSILVVVSLIFSYRFMDADQVFTNAKNSTNLLERKELLVEAVSQNPYNVQYLDLLSDTYVRLTAENQASVKDVRDTVNQMIELEPNNSRTLYRAGVMVERLGLTEEALDYYDEALDVDPYDTKIYETMITSSVDLARERLETGDRSEAEELITHAVNTYSDLEEQYESFKKNPIGEYHNSRQFEITDQTIEKMEEAQEVDGLD